MSTTATRKVAASPSIDTELLARVAHEGYGPGAWHGNDMKAALDDVTPTLAFWRPGAGRHNIAEIAVHHAFTVRAVREKLTGAPVEAFALTGEDWFGLDDESALSWKKILDLVATQQKKLESAIADLGAGRARPAADVKPFDLVLGITCHAIYHAGQVQLIKKLASR
jgi:hypothetical protein